MDVVSVRARPGAGLGFKGRAALYNKRTWIGPPKFGFWEEIAPGAFDRAVTEDDVRFLVDHDPGKVLARTSNATLRLTSDKKGLGVDADMADVSYARDLVVLLERGDLGEMSFAFVPGTEEWSTLKDGTDLRRLVDFAQVLDVSCVAFPAYAGTEAAMRAVEARRTDATKERLLALRRRLETLRKEL
jgi:Escherichia/Staphylococcus phage prohead protease